MQGIFVKKSVKHMQVLPGGSKKMAVGRIGTRGEGWKKSK